MRITNELHLASIKRGIVPEWKYLGWLREPIAFNRDVVFKGMWLAGCEEFRLGPDDLLIQALNDLQPRWGLVSLAHTWRLCLSGAAFYTLWDLGKQKATIGCSKRDTSVRGSPCSSTWQAGRVGKHPNFLAGRAAAHVDRQGGFKAGQTLAHAQSWRTAEVASLDLPGQQSTLGSLSIAKLGDL